MRVYDANHWGKERLKGGERMELPGGGSIKRSAACKGKDEGVALAGGQGEEKKTRRRAGKTKVGRTAVEGAKSGKVEFAGERKWSRVRTGGKELIATVQHLGLKLLNYQSGIKKGSLQGTELR